MRACLRPLCSAVVFGVAAIPCIAQPPDRIASFGSLDLNGPVIALAVIDVGSGPALYAGGDFTSAGGVSANRVAKWDGASWSALGSGVDDFVFALAEFDDGSGPALYAGGVFTTAGGVSATNIAKWNGSSWSALGTGVRAGSGVETLCVFDDGSGPALYAGGYFSIAGGVSADNVAKWDGSSWSALGSGIGGGVAPQLGALATFNDGSGRALYAGGDFTTAGGASASSIAKWDGSNWSALGSGTNGYIAVLVEFDDGFGPVLYAGGGFTTAGGVVANYIAKWNGASWFALGSEPGEPYCFGDGVDSVVTALCPCGNAGFAGRGCANSNSRLGGARLFATGTTSPNTIVLTCDGVPNNNLSTFLRGTLDDSVGVVFGDGVKCASGTVLRFAQQTAGQGGNPSNTVIALPATVGAGNTRYYQVHYRNPSAVFCPPALFNISNAYRLSW